MTFIVDFKETLVKHYPFNRYIFRKPVKLDLLPVKNGPALSEICFLSAEIGIAYNNETLCVKFIGNSEEMLFPLCDFDEDIQFVIANTFIEDFGNEAYECLGCDSTALLKPKFLEQQELITQKYGCCLIRPSDSSHLLFNQLNIMTSKEGLNDGFIIASKSNKRSKYKKVSAKDFVKVAKEFNKFLIKHKY